MQGYLQEGSVGLRNGPQQMGNFDIYGFSHFEETLVQQAEAKRQSSKIRKLDRGQSVFVFSVKGIVTLVLAFSAALYTVPRPLIRAHYHSLLRLKDACCLVIKSCPTLHDRMD